MPPVPTRLGLQIPNFNFPGVDESQLFGTLTDIATTAEASGFDSIWLMDHLNQIPGVGPMDHWMLEGNTGLAALSSVTSRMQLGLMVGSVTYRNPAYMAKVATTLDVLSGGRAILGIGAGWFEAEHVAFGYDFPPIAERFERLEEALQIARGMFTQDETTFSGEHFRVEKVMNRPRPIRGDIPIMIGGSGEKKTLRMVAQYADGSNIFGDLEQAKHLVGVLEAHCERLGRDPSEITKTRLGTLLIAPTHEAALVKRDALLAASGALSERLAPSITAGDPDTVAEQFSAFIDAGLDGIVFNIPDVHDLEVVQLAGQTLAAVAA